MKTIKNSLLILSIIVLAQQVFAQSPNISYSPASNTITAGVAVSISPSNSGGAVPATVYGQVSFIAGSTNSSTGLTNGTGTSARFNWPMAITSDGAGNLYIGDYNNNVVRKVTTSGVVTTYAGSPTGASGYKDTTVAAAALFSHPCGLALDASGNLYVSDHSNDAIRKISTTGAVTTFYHQTGMNPYGLSFDGSGNLLVAGERLGQILKISPSGVATVVAGALNGYGYVNGTGTGIQFAFPSGAVNDASGNIFVCDYLNNDIRKVPTSGSSTTFAGAATSGNAGAYANGAGTSARFNNPTSLTMTSGGVLYVTDLYNNAIRRIMPDGTVSNIAGSATQSAGYADGLGTSVLFNQPDAIYVDGTGNGYITELIGGRVRKIVLTGYTLDGVLPAGLTFDSTTGTISGTTSGPFAVQTYTVTAYNTSGYSTTTITLNGVAAPAPQVYYDYAANQLTSGNPYTISPVNTGGAVPAQTYAQVATAAGSTTALSGFTNGLGTAARFNAPVDAVTDQWGNVFIADQNNNAIREMDPSGNVTTFAGSTTGASGNSDATGTLALFNSPDGLAIDAAGNLYVSDYNNNSIRKITSNGVVSTFYHSAGTFGPSGLLVDNSGNIIVAAQDLNKIQKITPSGVVTTIAGSGTAGYVNSTTAASAQFNNPSDVKMDAAGNLFVADYLNNAIRKIDQSGAVTTFAGSDVAGNTGAYLDGVGTAARFNQPTGIAIAPGGVIYVADFSNNAIRRIMPDQTVSLVAGSTTQASGNADGLGTAAAFNQPDNIYIDPTGTAYVTEYAGNRVRKIPLMGYSLMAALPTGLSFNPATGTVSGTVSGTVTPTTVSIAAFNSGGLAFTILAVGGTTNDWKGGTSTDWNVATNWSANHVPGSAGFTTETARIGVVAYSGDHEPNLNPSPAGTTTIGGLSFGILHSASSPTNGPVLTIATNQTLKVNGTTQAASGSIATIAGPGILSLNGTTNVVSGATLNTVSSLFITMANGSSINNNGTFSLGSDASGSVSIDKILSPATTKINGQITVKRWITGGTGYRGYRLISSPVYAAPVTFTNGTNTNTFNAYGINFLLNDTYLTGTDGTAGGFSTDTHTNPSLYIFREDLPVCNSTFICGQFQGIKNIAQTPLYNYLLDNYSVSATPYAPQSFYIPVGTGVLFWWRGHSPETLLPYDTGTVPVAGAVQATGLLNIGNITCHYWLDGTTSFGQTSAGANGLNLVGNPYPSTIDWNTISTGGIITSNVSTQISELNPATGSYGTYDPTSGGNNGANRYIVSGQGFFITATSPGASLTFTENAKVNQQLLNGDPSMPLLLSKSPIADAGHPHVRLEMNSDTLHAEDVLFWFDSSNKTNFEAGKDARYRLGFNTVSLSSLSTDGIQLGIDKQPLPGKDRRVIGLNVDATSDGTYHFNLREVAAIPQLYNIWLVDAQKKDSVNLRVKNTYDFTISKGDNTSFGDQRFSLVIEQNPALAYKLLDFTASKLQTVRQVQTVWKTRNEENYTNFTVERSTDGGKTFDVLGAVKAAGNGNYSFIDKSPLSGTNLYRLKQEDINNAISYSKVVPVEYSDKGDDLVNSKISIYPNPATGNINVSVKDESAGAAAYKIRIVSTMGTVVKEVASPQPGWQGNVSSLLPGTYMVRIFNSKTQDMVAEGKFVKL